MQGADFIFFFQDAKRRFWGIDAAGSVTLTANPYPIQYSPDGWQDTTIKNVRNRKYWAIDRSASLAFKYVEDAAKILKQIFYTRGVEEQVFLVICEQRLDYTPGVSYGFWYKQIFRSEIDLSTFLHEGPVVTCNTLEDGLAKHLKANESTVYEFDLDEYVKMDGVVLKNSFQAIIDPGNSTDGNYYFGNHIVGLNVTNTEIQAVGSGRSVSRTKVANSNSAILATDEFFLNCTTDTTITVEYNFDVVVQYTPSSPGINPAAQYLVVVRRIDASGFSDLQEILLQRFAADGIPGTYPLSGTFSMPIREGDKLFLYAFCNIAGATGDAQIRTTYPIDDETIFKATFDYRFKTTYCKYKRPQNLFSELIDRMTDGQYTAEDCLFFGSLYNLDKVFTSGDAIRGIEDAKLKISFAQFFEFFDTYDAVGIREKNGAVLFDRKKNLTDDVNVISLGEVARLKVKLDKAWQYNELAVGYPDVKNENGVLNGKNEVNTTSNFSFGTTKTPAKLQKVSRVKASCYDIENLRIQGTSKGTTDNRADNDPYVLHIGDTLVAGSGDIPDHYELNRAYNAFVTGVDQVSSVFNLALSPKNCLRNSGDYLRSCLWKYESKKLKFLSADRNSGMIYNNGSVQIIENADVPVSDLADPFFTPVLLEIEVSSLPDLLDDLDEIPTRCMQFTFEGETYKGIPIENSVNPGTLKKQTFTLLSHPDNDLSNLIEHYG